MAPTGVIWWFFFSFLSFSSSFFCLPCAYCPFYAQWARGRCHTFGGPNVTTSQYTARIRDDLKQSWPTSFNQKSRVYFSPKNGYCFSYVSCMCKTLFVVFFIRMAKSKIISRLPMLLEWPCVWSRSGGSLSPRHFHLDKTPRIFDFDSIYLPFIKLIISIPSDSFQFWFRRNLNKL